MATKGQYHENRDETSSRNCYVKCVLNVFVFIMTFQGQACLIYTENSQIMKTSRTQYMFIWNISSIQNGRDYVGHNLHLEWN